MYKILVKNKEGLKVTEFDTVSKSCLVTVGKESENNITLRDASVSAQHCVFEFDGDKIIVKDLKSRNGVILNGERIRTGKSPIVVTDEIQIGIFIISFEKKAEDIDYVKKEKKKSTENLIFNGGVILAALIFIFVFLRTTDVEPVKISEIRDVTPVDEGAFTKKSDLKGSWRVLLSKAKDAYFNNDILNAAKLFEQVLDLEKDNFSAKTFLAQIKNEMIPEIEKTIQVTLEERNIVSCAKKVEELMILDPDNKWIVKARNFLEGYSVFDEVRKLYASHRFIEAQNLIQSIVLVDEETLAKWRRKIELEVKVTKEFETQMMFYRNGPLPKALNGLKRFTKRRTTQKLLQKIAKNKIGLIRKYYRFKKLEQTDPIKQAGFGVSLMVGINEHEDPFIHRYVIGRLDELKKLCGPGTDFFILLNDDTSSQMDQAQSYKAINEIKFALSNYKNAIEGLRVVAFFSQKEDVFKREKDLLKEIKKYHESLNKKIQRLKAVNEFEAAEQILKMLRQFRVDFKEDIVFDESDLAAMGDDAKVIEKLLNSKVVPKKTEEKNKSVNVKKTASFDGSNLPRGGELPSEGDKRTEVESKAKAAA